MADLQKYKPLLHDNPLCGISTYKDTLNLATGDCTRQIKKLVLTGDEDWSENSANFGYRFRLNISNAASSSVNNPLSFCTHFSIGVTTTTQNCYTITSTSQLIISLDFNARLADFKSFLSTQYANGTPVIVWYVLATAETETIPVPTGLSGTEEGYLIQDGTPTPTNPVYPTANEVLIWLHSLRKLTTSTDTFTTLPVDVYADGNNATVGISGNTVQSGTPTPDNPIMPQGTGDMVENLFDKTSTHTTSANTELYTITGLTPNQSYTCSTSFVADPTKSEASIYFGGGNSAINGVSSNSPKTMTANSNGEISLYIRSVQTQNSNVAIFNDVIAGTIWVMVNEGTTALPYGYKIPISSANTTTPVYLGEVESTRRIKKLVLDGAEDWSTKQTGEYKNFSLSLGANGIRTLKEKSTHFQCIRITEAENTDAGFCIIASGLELRIRPENVSTTSLNDFKSYLAAQYAAGTPVVVYYVLANEETGIVNEPLMKIGDYADTVSGISIPTITGKDTFDVLTTLKPSEVSLSYTGWHDATVEEWDGSQWNE